MQGKNYVPSTPSMSTIPSTSNKNEVSSKLQDIALYHIFVTRIDINNQYVALYQNNFGMVYKTMRLHSRISSQELTLHVYEKNGSDQLLN